jgi:steroid 5-alpha reductase family enzyme
MFILVTIWGFRLSYNFYRKGGYNIIPWKGDEDYRWRILRESPALKGRIRFGLFNLFFISLYQNFVILMFCSPLFLAAADRDTSLRLPDIIAATMMLLFIIAESTADNQLFRFQTMKRQGASSEGKYAESLKNGFICEGLWRYVRHPNYTSEQAVWVCFYIFGAAASGRWLNWTIIGPLLLVLLFQGSSTMTENISMGKYPDYAGYRKKVPGFLPRLF